MKPAPLGISRGRYATASEADADLLPAIGPGDPGDEDVGVLVFRIRTAWWQNADGTLIEIGGPRE